MPGRPSGAPRRRPPRRTIWSQIASGSRSVYRSIAGLPRPLLIVIGAVLFVIVATMVIDSALYYNKVHAGISMAEQDLGGATYDEALNLLEQRIQEFDARPITLVSGAKQWTVTPEQVGQIVDIDASIEAAMQVTRKSNLVADLARRLGLYFDSENFALVGEVDQTKLDAFVAQIAGELDVLPVDQALLIEGDTIETVEGTSGFVVDQDKLKTQVLDALFAQNTAQIEIPMTTKAPEVEGADTAETADMVQTMLSDDVTLTYLAPRPADTTTTTTLDEEQTKDGSKQQTTTTIPPTTTTIVQTSSGKMTFVSETKTFTPSQMKDLLDYRAEERDGLTVLVPYISPDMLNPFFSRIEGPMTVPATDAWFNSDRGFNCWVEPGQVGKGLDHEATAEALTVAALSLDDRTAEAIIKDIEPDFSTEDANAMGITTLLGSYETVYESRNDRAWNVELAAMKASSLSVEINKPAEYIDRIAKWSMTASGSFLLAPGDEYDFIKTVGPRTTQAGFLGAFGIEDGVLVDGILGGGICQVSTTLFNAALRAGLKITERWNHSIFIDHYPAGADATVTGGGAPKNLRFVNDTPNYVWIYGWSDGTKTIFSIFGTSDGRRVVSIEPSDRYDVTPMPEKTVTVLDPKLPENETSIAFAGQDEFKITLTRVIEWPDGHTTSEEWYSEWEAMRQRIAVPTSTTTTVMQSSMAATLATP